jgi:hypothetical protein
MRTAIQKAFIQFSSSVQFRVIYGGSIKLILPNLFSYLYVQSPYIGVGVQPWRQVNNFIRIGHAGNCGVLHAHTVWWLHIVFIPGSGGSLVYPLRRLARPPFSALKDDWLRAEFVCLFVYLFVCIYDSSSQAAITTIE